METQPLGKTEDRHLDGTPEDVAILYSWANLEGAKYRDFSANRREYRAQMRHRAAEQLRLMELRAQFDAEAAAVQAEFEAAAAHAQADAATVKLNAMPTGEPDSEQQSIEAEVEIKRHASLREAALQARKATAERLEAARRAEAAALADSIARLEEREIAEARASALRQAAQYAEAEPRTRQKRQNQPKTPLPGKISDPYGPQPIPEGEYFERPGTPVSELTPNRFRQQREYIEKSTGAVLPPFRGSSVSSAPQPNHRSEDRMEQRARPTSAAPPPATPPPATDVSLLTHAPAEIPTQPLPRPVPEMGYVPNARDAQRRDENRAQTQRREEARFAQPEPRGRVVIPSMPYPDSHWSSTAAPVPPASAPAAEVVSRITQPHPSANPASAIHNPAVQAAPAPQSSPVAQTTPAPQAQGEERDIWGVPWEKADALPTGAQPLWSRNTQRPEDPSDPAWIYSAPQADGRAGIQSDTPPTIAAGETLQHSREQVASRWHALKGVFDPNDLPNGNRNLGISSADPAPTSFARPYPPYGPAERQSPRQEKHTIPFVVVFSLTGGVGKTSLVATLGRTLSSLGEKVLLTDTTSHGLLPFYFGASELHTGVVRTFMPPIGSTDAPIHIVSYETDRGRGRRSNRPEDDPHEATVEDLVAKSQCANRVLLDVDPSSACLLARLARLKPTVLVPLAADMNSVLGLQAVERCFNGMKDAAGDRLRPFYLLNQFDASLPLQLDVREALSQQLGDRLLPFVVRRSAAVSEALAEGMTIVDYDPASEVVRDYLCVANWLRGDFAPTAPGLGNMRWSER
jgi:cellulose synthase operon protein YhjQ